MKFLKIFFVKHIGQFLKLTIFITSFFKFGVIALIIQLII